MENKKIIKNIWNLSNLNPIKKLLKNINLNFVNNKKFNMVLNLNFIYLWKNNNTNRYMKFLVF